MCFLFRMSLALGLSLVLYMLAGCSDRVPKESPQLRLLNEVEKLYRTYLEGDRVQAERALKQAGELVESATNLEPSGRAFHLAVTHCRLFVLAERTGNRSGMQLDFIKSRYWLIKGMELDGMSAQQVLEGLGKYDEQHIIEYVNKIDRAKNINRLPRYAAEIEAGRSDKPK
jgi:hypothetical protein